MSVILQKGNKVLRLILRGTKFNLVGLLGMLVNSGCLYLLKGAVGIPLIPASVISIEIAIVHNFIWHRHWTWRDRNVQNPPSFIKQLLVYNIMTGLVDLSINVIVLWALTTIFGVYFMIANVFGMIMGPCFKFWINEKFIFRSAE